MASAKHLLAIDVLAFFSFLISLFSGIVLWLILPSGSGFQGGRNLLTSTFLNLTRHNWNDIHLISSLLLSAIIIYHILIHWNWIRNIPKIIKN